MALTEITNKRVKPVCPNCDSSDLRVEAYVAWHVAKQAWEIVEITENQVCNKCGRDNPHPKWSIVK